MSPRAIAAGALRRMRHALSEVGLAVGRRLPPDWAAEALLARLRADPGWLPPGNLEIAHRLDGALRRLADPGGGNRWLHHRWARLACELREDLEGTFAFPSGFTAVCLGVGIRNGLAFPLLVGLMGARRVKAVEPEPLAVDEEFRVLWGLGETALRVLAGEAGVPGLDAHPAALSRFVRLGPLLRGESLAGALAPDLVWRRGTAESLELEPASVDLVTSRSVMEHVADLHSAYRAMATALRPGGVLHHAVDLSSHDPDELAMYRRPSLAPGARLDGINEQRLSDHVVILRDLGLEVWVRRQVRTAEPIDREAIQPRFRRYADEDLLTTGAVLVARRP
jgi:SAM-dependent methyltransferase